MSTRSLKFRVSVLDVLLIILVILSIVGLIQRQNLQRRFSSDSVLESYTVTFEAKKLRSTTVNLLERDTAFYLIDGTSRVALGSLTERVAATAATVYLQTPSGETVKAVYPQDDYEYLLDVSGTLNCRGVERDGSFLVGGTTYLAVNQVLVVETELADLEIRITGIERAAA